MLKLLIVCGLLSSGLLSKIVKTPQEMVVKYEKRRISRNSNIKLNDLKLVFVKKIGIDNWYGYMFDINITLIKQTKNIVLKDILFSNGKIISPEIVKANNGFDFRKIMYPTLTKKYFNKDYLIAGNLNAKHKIVIFSDPLCPICIETMPELIKDVKANPTILSLYYIHMPLDMHPTAKLITKASILAKQQGIKDIDYKVYTAKFEDEFDPYEEKNKQKVLNIFNKKFNTKITLKQLNNKALIEDIKYHKKLSNEAFVQGTPTIFFDGEIDNTRVKYMKYIK